MNTTTPVIDRPAPERADIPPATVKPAAPVVVSIVGIDGCGKSSTFRDALTGLMGSIRVGGVGDQVWTGGPDEPLRERIDVPHSRFAGRVGRAAKGSRRQALYKNLKFLELTERTKQRDYLAAHERPDAILTDGESMVNAAAWAVSRYYTKELAGDDEELDEALRYLTGEETIPLRQIPYYLRRSWQLLFLNRLRLGRFSYPDMIFLLEIDPAVAMERIRARGRPLQTHETEEFLGELGRAYQRVCSLLQERRGIPVVRLRVDQLSHEEVVQRVVDATLTRIRADREAEAAHLAATDRIDVVATTMSGSIKDQRKVGRIAPEFQSRTERPVRVYPADSHAEAQAIARDIVSGGGRLLVSAGGAGTFNAVLEGAHVEGSVPSDLRLAFLRKGSADLIGKVLGIPDELPEAVRAIVGGIESGATVDADILEIDAHKPGGTPQRRHLIGFGGFGLFGDVPRFTESRVVKFYKGILGTLFGDLGPFFVGLGLASIYWQVKYLLRREPALTLTLDDEELPPAAWGAVVLMNGDLGHDFVLGRGLDLASGTFRVIGLRYTGPRRALRAILACRSGDVLDHPERYDALVREVRTLRVRPANLNRTYMINVDGLRMMAKGEAAVSVAGKVHLVPGRPEAG